MWVVYDKPHIEQNDLAKHKEDDSAFFNGYIVVHTNNTSLDYVLLFGTSCVFYWE